MQFQHKAYIGGLFFLVILSAAIHWQWILLPGILTAGDWWYLPNDVLKEYLTTPKILEGATDFTPGTLTPTFNILRIAGGVFALFIHAFPVWERALFLWPIAMLGTIPMYLLLYRRFSSSMGAFAGALVYAFNSYVLAREVSHVHIALAYLIFMPLLLLALDTLLSRPSLKTSVLFTCTAIGFSVYEIRILYITILAFALYTICQLATKSVAVSLRLFSFVSFSILCIALTQSFWLVPFMLANSSLGYAEITQRDIFPSFTTIYHALTVSDPSWNGTNFLSFTTQKIQALSYILPFFAILWIFIKPKQEKVRDLWFWTCIAAIGIFLAKGQQTPFPDIYSWLFERVPGFRLFRESSKFNVLIGFSYAILIGATVTFVQKRRKSLAVACTILIAVWAASNTIPFIRGSVKELTIGYSVPNAYKNVQNILKNDMVFSRSLWIPATEPFVDYSEQHPKVSAGTVLSSQDWQEFVKNPEDAYSFFAQPIAKALLNFGSIKYVGLPQDTGNELYQWYNRNKTDFSSLIASMPGLTPIIQDQDNLSLWQNDAAKPHIYIANNVIAANMPAMDFSGNDPSTDTAFVFQPDVSEQEFEYASQTIATNYEATSLSVNPAILSAPSAITYVQPDPQGISAEIIAHITDGTLTLLAHPSDGEDIRLATIENPQAHYAIGINDSVFPFNSPEESSQSISVGLVRLLPQNNTISIYGNNNTEPLISDPSFEQGTWGAVGDCNNTNAQSTESSGIASKQISNASDGAYALEITVAQHIGCVSTPILNPERTQIFIGSINYLSETNTPGNMKIIEDAPSFKELAVVQFRQSKDWQHASFSFKANEHQPISMYLYQQANTQDSAPARGVFDNIQVNAYGLISQETINLPDSLTQPSSHPFTQSDIPAASQEIDNTNVLEHATISLDSVYDIGDCNNTDNSSLTKNGIAASTVDTGNGTYALSLQAKRHIACVTFNMTSYKPAFNYILTINYKTISGSSPWIGIYPNNDNVHAKLELQKSPSWKTYTTTIPGTVLRENAKLYVYVSGEHGSSNTLFRSISLQKVPATLKKFITTTSPTLPPITATLETIDPETHVVHIEDMGQFPRLLILSDRFNPGWRLFARTAHSPNLSWIQRILWHTPGIEISAQHHIKVNAFTNGWILDPQEIRQKIGTTQNIELVLEYWPQRLMDIGSAISLFAVIALLGLVGVLGLRGLRKPQASVPEPDIQK